LENITITKNLSKKPIRNRILVGTPTLGIIRAEWAQARYGQIIPCNWTAAGLNLGLSSNMPLGFLVAEAQNIITDLAVRENFQWVLFIEDDVILPVDAFIRLNEYMKSETIPVVSGLYFIKCTPSEPLVYRGRGNACFSKFKPGELVWADGVPTGCLLVNTKVLKILYDEAEEYVVSSGQKIRRVFETPAKAWCDPETNQTSMQAGTSDLRWCDEVIKKDVLRRAGWKAIGKKKYPFLVDTNLFCKHIDLTTGRQWP
jgi:hypothetical protein